MRTRRPAVCSLLALAACSSVASNAPALGHGDGLSEDTAVQLGGMRDQASIEAAEANWLASRLPGGTADKAQARFVLTRKVLHVVPVTLDSGRKVLVYFELASGKT